MDSHILIADDHGIIRTGLKLLLQLELGISGLNVDETESCHDLMSKLRKKRFSHLILDIILPDGNTLEIIPFIRKVYPHIKILVFSMQPEEVYANALKAFDIFYYVSKSVDNEKLSDIMKKFVNNEEIAQLETPFPGSGKKNTFSSLTVRELQVLHYLLNGMNTQTISDTLNIQMSTVSTFKKSIFKKTNTANLRQLIELASIYHINY